MEPNDEPAPVGGAGRFVGLDVAPPMPEGGEILPDAGRRGRVAMGRCFGGSSRSSTRGSLLQASNLLLKKFWTRPIWAGRDSVVMRGYCGGGGKRVTVCVELE